MAEPDNLVLVLLREIRAKQDEHDRQFNEIERRFSSVDGQFVDLNKKIDEWQETTATAVGLATHANLRNAAIEAKIADLAERVVALERARGT